MNSPKTAVAAEPTARNDNRWHRHPLVVSIGARLVGTVLTYVVVPLVTYQRTLKEKRLEKALELLTHDADVNQRLNTLLTTLEIFHKDNSGVAARLVDYKEEQNTLRHAMMDRYLEFDASAWWWYGKVRSEAVILRLTSPSEVKRIDDLAKAYESKLIASTGVLNELWNRFLREEYRPTDIGNNVAMAETQRSRGPQGLSRQNYWRTGVGVSRKLRKNGITLASTGQHHSAVPPVNVGRS